MLTYIDPAQNNMNNNNTAQINQINRKKQKSDFKILHQDMQCMKNKIEEFEAFLIDEDPDVVCVKETWCSDDDIKYIRLLDYSVYIPVISNDELYFLAYRHAILLSKQQKNCSRFVSNMFTFVKDDTIHVESMI